MKTILNISVLTCLFFAFSIPCFAERSIAEVSKERAKELGIVIRSEAAGPKDVWVKLEFEVKGELKGFTSVSLEIKKGEKRISAELREDRSKPGRVVVSFRADRASLDNIMLWVLVTGVNPMGMTEYTLQMKDFVDLDKLH